MPPKSLKPVHFLHSPNKTGTLANMRSEITEEVDEEPTSPSYSITKEAERDRIRQIIVHQRSLYGSLSTSSSFSSLSSASCSSFSSSSLRSRSSLLDLMRGGSTSLRRLFEMEHTSLLSHFKDYSGSPVVKTIPLWGSDTDDGTTDYWAPIRQMETVNIPRMDTPSTAASDGSFPAGDVSINQDRITGLRRKKLTRKKSFRRLPRFRIWRWKRFFRFGLRLRRLRIRICGRWM